MEDPWSNEKCLELIDLYEKHTELWDSKHPLYYHKKNRNESWQKVASHFGTDITSIKRKMFSLLGSFRIQKSKGKEIVGEGPNKKEIYVSKWFAFERMAFLLDQKESQHENDSCDVMYETFEIKEESDSDVEFYESEPVQNMIISDARTTTSPNFINKEPVEPTSSEIDFNKSLSTEPKRCTNVEIPFVDLKNQNSIKSKLQDKQNSITVREENLYKRKAPEVSCNDQHNKIVRLDSAQQKNVNNCISSETIGVKMNSIQIFSQYIASKLQGYSAKTRAVAEHAINNVLFEADLGRYETKWSELKLHISPRNKTYFKMAIIIEETWSNEKCLELLDKYEKYPVLWDTKHPNYYSKTIRTENWQKVADYFDTDVANIKRKICSLMGSFRAQKAKGKEIIGEGSNAKEVYVSKWFAFERMLFLLGQTENPRNFGDSECDEGTFDTYEIKYEVDSDVEYNDNPIQSPQSEKCDFKNRNSSLNSRYNVAQHSEFTSVQNSLQKTEETNTNVKSNLSFNKYTFHCDQPNGYLGLKKNLSDDESSSFRKRNTNDNNANIIPQKKVRVDSNKNNKGSQCEIFEAHKTPTLNQNIFGQYVNYKIQGYSSKTKAIVEHAINNIFFEADMGWYENVSPQPQSKILRFT
ncbi:uncharacterized protein LOC129618961 [Condylostylus longicornis]|uniref:uncharacterized protein LOC129618961 n=1 Tax=Condylostylus longicornis TaxID=2530218 RepID=UPI00244E31F0|nr:uncharacterized protein LOC129618961 [Condylostylus longicornis]